MPSVLCAGIVTADLVFGLSEPVREPIKYRAETSVLTSGGCALNAAVAIARLGGRAHLAAAIGDDAFGAFVRREIADEGVGFELLVTLPGVPTARSVVLVAPGGERTVVNHRDPRLFAQVPPLPVPFAYDAALADTRWPAYAAAVLLAAREAGSPAVLDAEAPVASAADAVAAASHVAFSEQGLADYIGRGDPEAALAEAAARLGVWVCVTRGPASVLCHDGATAYEVQTFAVEAVDTLGAGDVWHGAFALGLSEGRAEGEAVRRANAVAALKTCGFGGRRALPDRSQLERFLKEPERCN